MTFESVISEGDAAAAVLADAEEWQRIMALDAEKVLKVLDVYLDIKSPYAYLAVRPSLEVARDYRVRVNFLPYTMSYTAVGVTTNVEPNMKRRPATPAADRKARMYYTAARQYAVLQGLPFRSPCRLFGSALANKAFLFAKRQGLAGLRDRVARATARHAGRGRRPHRWFRGVPGPERRVGS